MMFDDWGWSYGGMGWGMGLGMLLFWGLVIAGIVALLRGVLGTSRPDEPPAHEHRLDAREILDQRYARGEIERAEYEQKRRDLDSP